MTEPFAPTPEPPYTAVIFTSLRAWKAVAEHLDAQRLGREQWYHSYRVRIATVEREYGFER